MQVTCICVTFQWKCDASAAKMELLICICATFLHGAVTHFLALSGQRSKPRPLMVLVTRLAMFSSFLGLSEVSRAGTGGTGSVLVEELVEELGPIWCIGLEQPVPPLPRPQPCPTKPRSSSPASILKPHYHYWYICTLHHQSSHHNHFTNVTMPLIRIVTITDGHHEQDPRDWDDLSTFPDLGYNGPLGWLVGWLQWSTKLVCSTLSHCFGMFRRSFFSKDAFSSSSPSSSSSSPS